MRGLTHGGGRVEVLEQVLVDGLGVLVALDEDRAAAEVDCAVELAVVGELGVVATHFGLELRDVLLALLEVEQIKLGGVAGGRDHFN